MRFALTTFLTCFAITGCDATGGGGTGTTDATTDIAQEVTTTPPDTTTPDTGAEVSSEPGAINARWSHGGGNTCGSRGIATLRARAMRAGEAVMTASAECPTDAENGAILIEDLPPGAYNVELDGDSNSGTVYAGKALNLVVAAGAVVDSPIISLDAGAVAETCGNGACAGDEAVSCGGEPGCTPCPSDCQGIPDKFFAVIVDDSQIFPNHRVVGTDPCATASSPLNAHGADIDAIGLFDAELLIGYLDFVDYQEGGLCPEKPNTMTDPDEAKAAPDATIDEGFVSLGGGFLAGELAGAPEIRPGDTLVIYEVGTNCGGDPSCGSVDEGYEVFIAHDLDCVNEGPYPYVTCALQLSDDAKGEATIPVSAF